MKNIIISKDGETLTVTEENIIAVAKLLGITPTELRKSVSQIFKSADAETPAQAILNRIKQLKKGK
ncbi:ACP S-malonyltransferase [Escherichia coli]|uniref:ACP S-malonyltransferase n=1 Tax=Escherichia TaxID=561 RepID=UPI000B7FADF5|nr:MULTISPECIES: ACP S-malonyltransferase [Escherichia]EII1143340.1 ACP S-malonyltransferase [Escherichia coli O121]EES4371873.1 ACP S-malonyltransferase [Escherichia coli]EES7427126.1 ACP S-malonyltransferase [Escherichia coli]EEU3950293.1 ACP S-malonyltransferase [Escherichia coli]EEU4080410.1 ACP S-malonyltransferase [Escherichia coli]